MRRAILLLFAAAQLSAQTKPTGSLHGIVKDKITGTPLAGAPVKVTRILVIKGGTIPEFDNAEGTVTDSGGRYTIPAVRTGDILLHVQYESHETVTQNVHLSDGDDLTVDFALPSAPSISGSIVDDSQKPANGLVWLIDSRYRAGLLVHDKIGPQLTDEKGRFTFESGLEAGRSYYILAERPLTGSLASLDPAPLDQRTPIEQTTYYGDASSLGAAVPVSLQDGEHREQINIKIRKAIPYCVDGRVFVSGEPGSALLTIREAALAGLALTPYTFQSGEGGTFHVCGLTPGEYSISSQNSTFGGATPITISDSDVHGIRLNLGLSDLHLELAWEGDPPAEKHPTLLPPLGVSYHATTTADGVPEMERTEIRQGPAIAEGSEIAVTLTTGEVSRFSKAASAPYSGAFASDLAPGDYSVEARVVSGCYVKELSYNGVPIPDRVIHLEAGIQGTLRVVASRGGGTVKVKVTDSDDKPVAGAMVVVAPQRADSAALLSALAERGMTDANGVFQTATLAPGKYRALALTRRVRPISEDLEKLLHLLPKSESVELDSDKSTVEVSLKALAIE